MRNPLFKRLPREFLKDIVKYIVMFFFLMIPLAVCSGYMIGNDSMIKTFNKAIDKYNLEDGHFQTSEIITDSVISEIELENDITIYDLSYKLLLW